MVNEDTENLLLIAIKSMLVKYFQLTKKFLTEKNAKLEMLHKNKKLLDSKA